MKRYVSEKLLPALFMLCVTVIAVFIACFTSYFTTIIFIAMFVPALSYYSAKLVLGKLKEDTGEK
ncbi:hypothetical protein RCF73_02970 [Staphylococcus chromogenes]|uniref:hypothetical protein n=1 Tax=Staphylococcus chromogenes TaxID=46126 RepID=UPI003B008BA4